MIVSNSHAGDAVVLVGDFNAGKPSMTIKQLSSRMHHIYSGIVDGGVDNMFTNLPASNVMHKANLGHGGSDHDALSVTLSI